MVSQDRDPRGYALTDIRGRGFATENEPDAPLHYTVRKQNTDKTVGSMTFKAMMNLEVLHTVRVNYDPKDPQQCLYGLQLLRAGYQLGASIDEKPPFLDIIPDLDLKALTSKERREFDRLVRGRTTNFSAGTDVGR